jgi:hypothetical protein
MAKLVKVKAKVNLIEHGHLYRPGEEFLTTYERYKALGKAVELVPEPKKGANEPKKGAGEPKKNQKDMVSPENKMLEESQNKK